MNLARNIAFNQQVAMPLSYLLGKEDIEKIRKKVNEEYIQSKPSVTLTKYRCMAKLVSSFPRLFLDANFNPDKETFELIIESFETEMTGILVCGYVLVFIFYII